ncbi:MAG: hypothetical protein ACRDS1_07095 [Pseudonocardiaceae bacterium]
MPATGGIIGLATILGAMLVSQDVAGWIVGLAVGLTSVILAALLVVITTAVITPTPTPRWSRSTASSKAVAADGAERRRTPTSALIYARTRHATLSGG